MWQQYFQVFKKEVTQFQNKRAKVDYPSAMTTQRRPDFSGRLNDVFASIPSLRALFILYSMELMSPWYHDGIRPQRIGRSTRSSHPPQSGRSASASLSSRCLLDTSTGLQTTKRKLHCVPKKRPSFNFFEQLCQNLTVTDFNDFWWLNLEKISQENRTNSCPRCSTKAMQIIGNTKQQ